jgi:ribokinase
MLVQPSQHVSVRNMRAPAEVVVVGSYVQDLCWSCPAFPQPGETTIGHFTSGPGGKGSNQAVAAGRAGAKTLFVGAVGRDVFAEEARQFYQREKISAHFVEKPAHATGTAAILVNSSGQNEIVVALGANAYLAKANVPATALRQAKIVVVQHESSLAMNAHVLKTARKAGVPTVLNPAPMRTDFDPAILDIVDILIPNETEFAALVNLRGIPGYRDFGESSLQTMSEAELQALCRQLGPAVVIVTLGSRGCFVSQAGQHALIPAHTGIKVVDTTGAGDAFVGGFAAGWVKFKGDLLAAASFGNTVAALSVTKPGTAPSMPNKREIAAFLRHARRD